MSDNSIGALPSGRDDIPEGPYCYASLSPMDAQGRMRVNGLCPHWLRKAEGIFCAYLNEGDDALGLLSDQVKICGVNDDWDEVAAGKADAPKDGDQ